MSATNSTTHYSLPSFLGSDKPAWLVDWNGAMATIDSAIYEAKQAADTASASAGAVASDLATLSGTVSTQGSTISTLSETLTTAVGNINTINGNITTINSLIGNGTPTTTDQTIIGAINEINANVTDASTPGTLANTVNSLDTDVDNLTSNNLPTATELAYDVPYTCTNDGYLITEPNAQAYIFGADSLHYFGLPSTTENRRNILFVKKGMKITKKNNDTNKVTFSPLS